jgi:hypothetical protein
MPLFNRNSILKRCQLFTGNFNKIPTEFVCACAKNKNKKQNLVNFILKFIQNSKGLRTANAFLKNKVEELA